MHAEKLTEHCKATKLQFVKKKKKSLILEGKRESSILSAYFPNIDIECEVRLKLTVIVQTTSNI